MFRVILALAVALALLSRGPAVSSGHEETADRTGASSSPKIDLYGNEVTGAVGDYRVTPLGELYEDHNPDTALLKLAPPSS
jgi:hypothetical protein